MKELDREAELKDAADRYYLRTIAMQFIEKFGDVFMKWNIEEVRKDIGEELKKLLNNKE